MPDIAVDRAKTLVDPFRYSLLRHPGRLPDSAAECGPRPRGEPAFDPGEIARAAADIPLPADIQFPHPLLEKAVRVGLAHVDATFDGDHPKYGIKHYGEERADGFPPTVIATVDALTLWGLHERAEELFGYWLCHFVRPDGTIEYYGPSLSEYGQLLTSARRLLERGGRQDWLSQHREKLERLASYLRQEFHRDGRAALLFGAPEADEHERPATYFHNNAWVARGLEDWAWLLDHSGSGGEADAAGRDAASLKGLLLEAVEAVWPRETGDWWLRPAVEDLRDADHPGDKTGPAQPGAGETGADLSQPVTARCLGSYTNYRYWPELLSSGMLGRKWMERIVEARLRSGGQWCGCTRYWHILDNWPLAEYLDGLWQLGRRKDYLLSLWGHILFHQADGHLTAYEQMSLPPGEECAPYCLPCQLVAVRAARRILG